MSRLAIIGIAIVAIFVLVAIFAPWIATQDVGATNLSLRYMAPSAAIGSALILPDATYFAGSLWRPHLAGGRHRRSRSFGFSRYYDRRVAGYYSGWIDRFFPAISSTCSSHFPDCFWRLRWWLSWGRSQQVIFALCVIGWVGYARLIRAQVLKVREYDFVQPHARWARVIFGFSLYTFCPMRFNL